MKYLEIRPGVNIKKEDCVCVEAIDEMTCKVWTSTGAYTSIYPSWRVLMLLEEKDIEEQLPTVKPETPSGIGNSRSSVNLWGSQYFAG